MAVILLRHTRPEVASGVCYGATDLPCADDFDSAAEQVLATLPGIDRIVSSPLHRCRRLAEHIATHRGVPLTADDRLQEMAFGSWENRSWSEIDRAEVDAWANDFHHARPHGGESVAMLAKRVGGALDEIERAAGTVLVVTHLGVIRAALARAGAVGAWQAQVAFGAWIGLDGAAHAPPLSRSED